MKKVIYLLLAGALVFGACKKEDEDDQADYSCRIDQPYPYPDGIPYVGVHANAANNDFIDCRTASDFSLAWHSLKGHPFTQPNTYSPDGKTTYATTLGITPDGPNLFAINVEDGSVIWSDYYSFVGASSVEVDAEGDLYFSTASAVVSLDSAGARRWRTPMPLGSSPEQTTGATGVHFTPAGDLATVSNDGLVFLLDRADGSVIDSLSIRDHYGFVPPRKLGGDGEFDFTLPDDIFGDISMLRNDFSGNPLAKLAGAGDFSDNTLGIAPNGDLYIIGGGVDGDHGALVQIKVETGASGPKLVAGWSLSTNGGSATSPSISPDGKYVSIADGSTPAAFLSAECDCAAMRIVDIAACDENLDADPDPAICAESYNVPLLSGPILGSAPMLAGGLHYVWEVQFSDLLNTSRVDVRAFEGDSLLWETKLPDDLQWSSVMTVSRTHLIGTATHATDSGVKFLSIKVPGEVNSELILLDRMTGEVDFRIPVTDDAASTITIGPDGSLYVTMLGIVTALSRDSAPTLGLMKFIPRR